MWTTHQSPRRRTRTGHHIRSLRTEQLESRRMLATITVDTLVDEQDGDINLGDVSLRDAINQAASNDVINFAVTGTITLTLGALEITRNLVIAGPGPAQLTIDASGNDPTPGIHQGDGSEVFIVNDEIDMSPKFVHLSGMTITGGDIMGRGGGVHSDEHLTLINTVIEGNAAVGAGTVNGRGGGIFAHRGSLNVRRSTIRDNFASQHGGGIRVDGIITNIVDSTIANNRANGEGGGVASVATGLGNLTALTNTTVSGNTAGVRGGGLWNSNGLAVIQHSTFTNNSTDIPGLGGGVGSNGQVTSSINASTEVYSSIIAGNIGSDIDYVTGVPPNHNTITSNGYNVIGTGNALSSFNGAGDQTNVTDPRLGPLAEGNGGTTATHALLAASPAIDRGHPNALGAPEFDQRNGPFSRIADGGVGGLRMDVGAVERQTLADINLVVDTLDDERDLNYEAGDLSLREAAALANGSVGPDTITFDASLFAVAQTIDLVMGEIALSEAIVINGPSPNGGGATIDAQFASRIFNITADAGDFAINGLALINGRSAGNNAPFETTYSGGAIRSVTTGSLTVADSIIRGNRAVGYLAAGGGIFARNHIILNDTLVSDNYTTGAYGYGGGVASFADVTLLRAIVRNNATFGNAAYGGGVSSFGDVTVTQSSISDNRTAGLFATGGGFSTSDNAVIIDSTINNNHTTGNHAHGGGLAAFDNVTITQSTVSGNSTTGSPAHGGGVYSFIDPVTIAHSTVTANQAIGAGSTGGGISHLSSPIALQHSIVADNTATGGMPDLNPGSGQLTVNFSLIGSRVTPDPGSSGNNIVTDQPLLSPLAENGGLTLTHAPLPGSPTIDAGDPAAMAGIGDVPEFDQRGAPFSRTTGGSNRIDIGAFESQTLLPCDFDGLSGCEINDLDALIAEIAAGSNDLQFDVTQDGMVNLQDRDLWLIFGGVNNPAQTGGSAFLLADGNLDGLVDDDDFDIWHANRFTTTGGWSAGDWNADGVTNGHDFLLWNMFKFQSSDSIMPLPTQMPKYGEDEESSLCGFLRSQAADIEGWLPESSEDPVPGRRLSG